MELLEKKILSCGKVLPGGILKVDSFLNHQLDVGLITEMGRAFYEHFSLYNITKILTVESSGIAPAFAAAQFFKVPVVFAKKGAHKNVGDNVYAAECFSYTKGVKSTVNVSKDYLSDTDNVLIIDDFLANGEAVTCMMNILGQAGAKLAGVGIVIEKGFQPGGEKLRSMGVDVMSLAIIESMTDTSVTFRRDGR